MVAAKELEKNQVPARNQVMTGSLQGFTTFCQLWNRNYAKPLEYSWLLRHTNLTATSSNFSEQIAKTVFAGHTECKCPAPGHKWLWLLGRNLSQNGPTQWFGTRSYLLEADEVLSLWPCNWKQKARLHWPCSSVCRGPYLNTSTERRQASASSFFPVLGLRNAATRISDIPRLSLAKMSTSRASILLKSCTAISQVQGKSM